jgi:hypothetical protein
MAICETPDFSETLDVQTPSEARQLAARWREEGARDVFTREGPRLLSVAAFLKDCADRAVRKGVRKTFAKEARVAETEGRKQLAKSGFAGSIEGGPITRTGS